MSQAFIQTNNRIKKEKGAITFYVISIIFVSILTVICFIPFVMLVSGSISDNTQIMDKGYSIFPRGFSTYAYQTILEDPTKIFNAYMVSITVTLIGTVLGVICIAMTGYVLSRPDFKYKDRYSFFLYFTTLFSGGIIPWYIMTTQILHLRDSVWALILTGLLSAFYIFLFKNFLKSIPHELVESAKIDGAGDFRVFWQIMMPLAKPAVATISLFLGLSYWNDWFHASLLISTDTKYPLQYVLFKMLANSSTILDTSVIRDEPIPGETLKLAMAMITTAPVLLFYPFAQKYFITGLTIGGVKG